MAVIHAEGPKRQFLPGKARKLGRSLGVARSAISVVLRVLVDVGAIRPGYREILILDRALLERYRDEE